LIDNPHNLGGYEPEQLSTSRISLSAGVLAVVVIAIIVILVRFERHLQPDTRSTETRLNVGETAEPPRGFDHWRSPRTDLRSLRTVENQRLHNYEWIDRKKGTVRIPIKRAMALIADNARHTSKRATDESENTQGIDETQQ